jgi:hypothetical protein
MGVPLASRFPSIATCEKVIGRPIAASESCARVLEMDVQIWLAGVSGVAGESEHSTRLNVLAGPNPYAPAAQVSEEGELAVVEVEHDVVALGLLPVHGAWSVVAYAVLDRDDAGVRGSEDRPLPRPVSVFRLPAAR